MIEIIFAGDSYIIEEYDFIGHFEDSLEFVPGDFYVNGELTHIDFIPGEVFDMMEKIAKEDIQ